MNPPREKILLLSSLLFLSSSLVSGYSLPGSGTSSDPYEISNLTDLNKTREDLDAHYELVNDIDATETKNWNSGKGFDPVGDNDPISTDNRFQGVFDGNGYTIENLTINRDSENYAGIFGFTRPSSEMKNVSLENADIEGSSWVGTLAGYNRGTISAVSADTNISGTQDVGGLVGYNYNEGDISESYSRGYVELPDDLNSAVGGLVGVNDGNISSSYSHANVTGGDRVGGLVGELNDGEVYFSYSKGKVTGDDDVGGLIGYASYQTAYSSYWDVDTSNQGSSADGTGLTTSEIKDQSNLDSFDFTNTWEFVNGVNDGYPVLQAFDHESPNQDPSIDSTSPDGINKDASGGVELTVEVSDPEGDEMDITFYDSSDDSQIGQLTGKSGGTHSVTWTGLNEDSSYSWYVEVTDGGGTVSSSTQSFSTIDIDLSWTDESSNENGFRIYNNASGSFQQVGSVGEDSTSYTDTSQNLDFNQYTKYKVRAYNSFGESDPLTGGITP